MRQEVKDKKHLQREVAALEERCKALGDRASEEEERAADCQRQSDALQREVDDLSKVKRAMDDLLLLCSSCFLCSLCSLCVLVACACLCVVHAVCCACFACLLCWVCVLVSCACFARPLFVHALLLLVRLLSMRLKKVWDLAWWLPMRALLVSPLLLALA